MSDMFRVKRGIVLDEKVSIIQGNGAPGITTDTDAAKVGSLYLDTLNGDLHIKYVLGAGLSTWNVASSATSLTKLYTETSLSPIPSVANATNSIVLGSGATTAITAHDSVAIGVQSMARTPGSVVQANGRFSSTGDAQTGKYLVRGITVNATETELFVDGTGLGGGTERINLPDDATWTFKAMITGHRTDVSDTKAGFVVEGVIYRINGASTISLLGKPTISILAKSHRQLDVGCYADSTTGSLKFTVTGQAGKIIRWLAVIDTCEITN